VRYECGVFTQLFIHYERHCISINHNEKEKQKLICNNCNKKFNNSQSFIKHKQNVHIYFAKARIPRDESSFLNAIAYRLS
jgi:hypothetical protein